MKDDMTDHSRTFRTSVYIGEALRRLLEGRPEEKGLWTRSGLLNTVASRYQEACRRHCPTLTLAEWCALMDALNGVWLQSTDHDAGALTSLWAEVYDADRLSGLGAKWHCDAKALAERMQAWDYATLVATADAVERWWATDTDGQGYAESIRTIVGPDHVAEARP